MPQVLWGLFYEFHGVSTCSDNIEGMSPPLRTRLNEGRIRLRYVSCELRGPLC